MSTRYLRPWRRKVAEAAQEMWHRELVRGSSGNVSVRVGDRVLITPTAVPYTQLRPRQIVSMSLEGRILSPGVPSSEWRLHIGIYRARADVKAIVHTHSPYATAAGIMGVLPVKHDEGRILFGSEIPVAKHAPPGTWELAQAAVAALGAGKAVLLREHGAVAVGSTLTSALNLAEKVEEVAELLLLSRTSG